MEIIEGKTGKWRIVIGLEVHAQVTSQSKLFSQSSTAFGAQANQQVSLVDAAFPGMLPVVNTFCIQQAVKTGLALGATINLNSAFDRKNYFYPDLPQGYQISQFYHPIVTGGKITIKQNNQIDKNIRIHHIHLEQDAGKSVHDYSPDKSHIDLNRSGVALMEIVSEPDLSSAEEAVEYVKKLRLILQYIGTCDGNMDQGSLRCDANVSVQRVEEEQLGTRCEIKNLNSTRSIARAIEYEAKRQVQLIEQGGQVEQETRLFNVDKNQTFTMRKKEDAIDYRYFPDPDLLPIEITPEVVDNIRKAMPELPDAKYQRYISKFNLTEYEANVLLTNKEVSDYFEQVIQSKADSQMASKWISVELFGRLNKANKNITNSPISPASLAQLLVLIADGTISSKIGKQVFDVMFETGKEAQDIIKEMNLVQITDESEITNVIVNVLTENQDKVLEYKNGKDKLYGFFVGQVMKKTAGKANPQLLNRILHTKLAE